MPIPEPVAFSVFGVDIRWYSILVTSAILVAGLMGYFRAPKYGIKSDTLLNMLLISVPCAIIGARAYYVIFNWSYYAGDFIKIINTREGGLAIHGGLIAGFGVAAILCAFWKVRPLSLLDLAAPSVAIAQCIGRWGNYFNSEAHGGPTDLPWAVTVNGMTYHPTFLYESIWCFLLFLFLMFMAKHQKFEGQLILLYGMLYSVERFFVESLRTDSLMFGPIKQAQLISVIIIVVCAVFYVILNRRSKSSAARK